MIENFTEAIEIIIPLIKAVPLFLQALETNRLDRALETCRKVLVQVKVF